MRDYITVQDITDGSLFIDPRKYRKVFTADNEPIYVLREEPSVNPTVKIPADPERKGVPLSEKRLLTVEEAAAYTGLGVNKIRKISDDSKCNFVIWNGNKRMLKRIPLVRYLEESYSI